MNNLLMVLMLVGCGSNEALKVYNSDPGINITSHSQGVIFDEGSSYSFLAIASDPNHDADELRAEWFLSGRLVCTEESLAASLESLCVATPMAGEDEIRVVVYDPLGASADDAISFSLNENQPPNIVWLSTEGVYRTNEPLIFSAQLSDDRTMISDLDISWQSTAGEVVPIDTVDSQGVLTSLLELPMGEQVLQLFVTDEGGLQSSVTLVIDVQEGSALPSISWITPSPASIENEGTHLLSVQVVDPEDGLEGLVVSFSSDVDGALGSVLSDGFGGASFNTVLSIGEHVLEAQVVDSTGMSVWESTTVVINDLPSAPTLVFSPAIPTTEDDITVQASGSVDAEGDAISYSFLWTDGNVQWSTETLPASMTERGDLWTVRVTPSDNMGDGEWTEEDISIENTPPSIVSGSILPNQPTVSDLLSALIVGSDVDGDTISYSYDWRVNGVSVGILDSLSGAFVRGDSISLVVIPDDGFIQGTSVQVGPVSIENSPPSAPAISISPPVPTEAMDDLICSVDVDSIDEDGDAVQYSISWMVDGVAYTGATTTYQMGDTVPASDTLAGEDWTCTVVPDDGIEDGPAQSTTVTVQADDGCPTGFTLAFDITDDASDQIPNDCAWLWDNLFSLGTQFSFEWWGDSVHYGPSVWDFSSEITSIGQSYNGCSGSNYNLPSSDGLYFMTLVQYNDLLHIHPYNDPAEDGTSFYYGRLSATHGQDDEIYAVGYSSWTQAWQNRFQSGDRFLACYQ